VPTYQYACTECENRFEQVQAFSDASLTQCPVCGGNLRKVYGSVGVVFKGSGFYRTDSRSGAAGAVSSDKSDSASSSDSKTDAKPAKESTPAGSKSDPSSNGSSSGGSSGGSSSGSPSSGSSSSGSSSGGSSSGSSSSGAHKKPATAAKSGS